MKHVPTYHSTSKSQNVRKSWISWCFCHVQSSFLLNIWVSYRSSTWRWHWGTHLAKTGGSTGQSRRYVTGEPNIWKVRWCKTPGLFWCFFWFFSRHLPEDATFFHFSGFPKVMRSWLTSLTSTSFEGRLGRKKHVQIASNCVVLPLGTQIQIGSNGSSRP